MLGIGIVGLPNVGKSTLFNAITKAGVEAANHPFATIDRNVGVVPVPDDRLEALEKLYSKDGRKPPVVPTTVEFVDIAGLVKGAAQGEGLGNRFLAHIREVAAVAHVVRCFEDPNIAHVSGEVDPLRDIEIIDMEVALADIAAIEKRLEKLRRSAKSNRDDARLVEACEAMIDHLSEGGPARSSSVELPADFNLLTAKPVIYVCNVAEEDLAGGNERVAMVEERAGKEGAEVIVVSARIEEELAELGESEVSEFLADLGIETPGLERLIRTGYDLLGLITFLTASEKEVRAWTVKRGTKAPAAAGEIHSDMERGFIRAEVIHWSRLVEAGSIADARSRGWLRTEGKEYVIADGDVIHFLFNV